MGTTYKPPRTARRLRAETLAARRDPEILRLVVDVSQLRLATNDTKRRVHFAAPRSRSLGADALLGELETHLSRAAEHLRLACDCVYGRGPYKAVGR